MLEDSEPVVVLTHGAVSQAVAALLADRASIDLAADADHWSVGVVGESAATGFDEPPSGVRDLHVRVRRVSPRESWSSIAGWSTIWLWSPEMRAFAVPRTSRTA